MTYPLLELAQRADDLADDFVREAFGQFTACDVERLTRAMLAERLPVYRAIAEAFRERLRDWDDELVEACLAAIYDSAGVELERDVRLATYYTGGERGARVGADRAARMIDEARRFGGFLRHQAPWLDDDAGNDE